MRRTSIAIVLVAALLALAAPVLAGGWATVRLDDPPGDVVAGVPWQVAFTVLQHDVSPNSDVTPQLRAQHKASGEVITASGRREGAAGHFVAELTPPRAGGWKWSITPQPYAGTSFETLMVRDADAPVSADGAPDGELVPIGESLVVEIDEGFTYGPASLAVKPGTTVTWLNRSTVAHTVTGVDLSFDDSGLIEAGASYQLTFDTPGTYHYFCAPHPGMAGVLTVT